MNNVRRISAFHAAPWTPYIVMFVRTLPTWTFSSSLKPETSSTIGETTRPWRSAQKSSSFAFASLSSFISLSTRSSRAVSSGPEGALPCSASWYTRNARRSFCEPATFLRINFMDSPISWRSDVYILVTVSRSKVPFSASSVVRADRTEILFVVSLQMLRQKLSRAKAGRFIRSEGVKNAGRSTRSDGVKNAGRAIRNSGCGNAGRATSHPG